MQINEQLPIVIGYTPRWSLRQSPEIRICSDMNVLTGQTER